MCEDRIRNNIVHTYLLIYGVPKKRGINYFPYDLSLYSNSTDPGDPQKATKMGSERHGGYSANQSAGTPHALEVPS